MVYRQIKGYKTYKICRFCGKKLNSPVINMGIIPLAGGFLKSKKDFNKETLFPLSINFCEHCYLLQTQEVISADMLFKNYFYFSSKITTLTEHFKKTAKLLKTNLNIKKGSFAVEIGANDGGFIKACLDEGLDALGIDPADNVVKSIKNKKIKIINDYFTFSLSEKIVKRKGKADIIFSSNTLAHIENINDVFNGIKNLLKDDGVLIFENHYLGNLINQMQYDMIYHEHQYYYSVSALEKFLKRHELQIFDVKFNSIHAGSISVYAQKTSGKRKIKNSVNRIIKKERKEGLTNKRTFIKFNSKMKQNKKEIQSLINKLKKQNKKIGGYGASGRGTVLMSYAGLTNKTLEYVVDDSEIKQGSFTPGNHLRIFPSEILRDKQVDYLILFAWAFWKEIKKKNTKYRKNGGKFIIPLPKVKII